MKQKIWRIRAYQRANGEYPIQGFLDNLDKSAPDHYGSVIAAVRMVAHQPQARIWPIWEQIDQKLFTLRLTNSGIRIFCHPRLDLTDPILVVLHGVKKKRWEHRKEEIARSHDYLMGYYERCVSDEGRVDEQWPVRPSQRARGKTD